MRPPREPQTAEHFENAAVQEHAARFGMWVFLASETLLFGALLALYTAYRNMYGDAFAAAGEHQYQIIGFANTLILVTSSFAVAWAVHSIRRDRRRQTVIMLGIAMLLGLAFLVLKFIEYAGHFHHGIKPGSYYDFAELPGHGAQIFFTLYYFLTGLHAAHVIAGVSLLLWSAFLVQRGVVTAKRYTVLDLSGLYWHLVDLVWIFLWPLLYLLR